MWMKIIDISVDVARTPSSEQSFVMFFFIFLSFCNFPCFFILPFVSHFFTFSFSFLFFMFLIFRSQKKLKNSSKNSLCQLDDFLFENLIFVPGRTVVVNNGPI